MKKVKGVLRTILISAMMVLACSKGSVAAQQMQYLIEYLVVEQSNVELGSMQRIVVGIDTAEVFEEAVLLYRVQNTGETFSTFYTDVTDGAVLFEIPFEEENQTGIYELDTIIYKIDGIEYRQAFEKTGIDAMFTVNQEVLSETEIVRIDADGNEISEVTVEEAIANASANEVSTFRMRRSNEVIVILDPGHDETHAGAQANGLGEEELNVKIAYYCKEELEKYNGVTVYVTRESNGKCPYPGTSAADCNKKRVEYAQSVGADIYVSLHNDSADTTSAHGATVIYPNKNYNPDVSEQGKELALKIEKQLVALGLNERGIIVENSKDKTKYPDGSLADYYAIIRRSKLVGIPAIIVEHAFITNKGDVQNFLNRDEKLKALGVADATGIASYYGLSKQQDAPVEEIPPKVPAVEETLKDVVGDQTNGTLVKKGGIWRYYENGVLNEKKTGFVCYQGGYFLVINGQVSNYSGLYQEPKNSKWYFIANGQIQTQYSNLALYDGYWFLLENGMLAEHYNGLYTYNGGLFLVAAGQLKTDYSGLYHDAGTGKWYFLSLGQVCDYTGLVLYDGAWFYVEKGILAEHYTGTVNYDGGTFNVVNGMVA